MGQVTAAEVGPGGVSREDRDLAARVLGEFREMPDLTLTVTQAARFFSLEQARCARILATLVHAGVLVTDGRAFARADAGRRCA